MESAISFTVNGQSKTVTTDTDRPILEVLREDLQLTGTKFGCGEGRCRACSVLLDGKPIMSCLTPVSKANGKTITTIEGIAGDKLHPVQEAFLAETAFQCGYCTAGMIMQTVALLASNPKPTDDQIVEWLDGNICRCGTYPRIVAAVHRAATTTEGKKP